MVCTRDDLALWSDFPKGLRVLLLDHDEVSASETKLKLESMDYIVSLFCNEDDALEATSDKGESFHVAIVEVTATNGKSSFRFLEMTKNLPTIAISNVQCLNTMMKCIALGAAEFLQKPLSEDKIKNIWQLVVHKAFNVEDDLLSKSLKPIKETIASLLQLQPENSKLEVETPVLKQEDEKINHENSSESDRCSGPSTPQLPQCGRFLDNGDCLNNFKSTKSSHVEIKSAENACSNSSNIHIFKEVTHCEEVDSEEDCLHTNLLLSNEEIPQSSSEDTKIRKSFSHSQFDLHANRESKKKMKVDWTPELHRRFVQAVEQLGIDQAIPSKILQLMKVDGLTRHNVASHLQKYRLHKRHILLKDENKRWQHNRDLIPKNCKQRPLVANTPYHRTSYGIPHGSAYSVWGHPFYRPSNIQMWTHAGYATLQNPIPSWPWKTYVGVHADAWGCPVMPLYGQQYPMPTQTLNRSNIEDAKRDNKEPLEDFYNHWTEEVIDEAVKEAISKPWLPLPLGLKPPSTDTVLSELHRKGIRKIPPPPHSSTARR